MLKTARARSSHETPFSSLIQGATGHDEFLLSYESPMEISLTKPARMWLPTIHVLAYQLRSAL